MTDNNQQYKWRQRKRRNTRITVWIILVILVSAGATFVYEGLKQSNPLMVAERYLKEAVGVDTFEVETGDRSLNSENQFVQDYTLTYTADGKETNQKLSLVQLNEKKYGLFEQWTLQPAEKSVVDVDLIAPAGSQVLIDSAAPDAESIKEDESLSPGAVCYHLTGVNPTSELQVNGLPFESYKGTLESSGEKLDIRDQLKISENAKVQMEELGKSMISELFTAIVEGKQSSDLSDAFAHVPNKDNLFRVLSGNLYRNDVLQVESISFEGFEASFGDIYYPGMDEESFVGIEMKLSYECIYEPIADESEDAQEETEEESETETEKESESETEAAAEHKEAVFYFRYQNGSCIVTSAEVPGVL